MDISSLTAYEILKEEEIGDIGSKGVLLRHKKSGARIVLIENDDDNKVFSIAFRTTPKDSTGVAHITEHTVLCGSRKFPPKDPFIELVKGSVNTFLNAITFPDKTMYPVASCNDTDFRNLMDVYLDAVFYPNTYRNEMIFRQEGWSIQLEDKEADPAYNGVVYNEMKGAFSSPDDVLARAIQNSLFPDNTYFYESGGDPEEIPNLTYEDFLDFHRTYYHPSNSYIYLYGKMDHAEQLDWLDREYLSAFEEKQVDSVIEPQRPFEEERTRRILYPITEDEDTKKNTYLAWSRVVGTSLDVQLEAAMDVLSFVLLETPGAPLRDALLEAGIGSDIESSYESGVMQPYFSIIAREAEPEDADRFEEVIRKELTRICEEGVDRDAVEAALNLMEFRFVEADYGSYPRGLFYGIDIMDSWLYCEDRPFDYLRLLPVYSELRKLNGTGYFEDLIRKWFLDNPHGSLVIAEPSRGMAAKAGKETARRLAEWKAKLSDDEVEALVQKTRALREYQETPSAPEELETIPMLSRSDLKREPKPYCTEAHDWDGATALLHEYWTGGIAYFYFLFDLSVLDQEDLPWLGLLSRLLAMVSTEKYGYAQLSNEINRRTGGITAGISSFPDFDSAEQFRAALGISARTMEKEIPFCVDMVREILMTSDLGEKERIRELVQKTRTRLAVALPAAGNATALTRATAGFSPAAYFADQHSGIGFYRMICELDRTFDESFGAAQERMRGILKKLLDRNGLLISYTGSREGFGKLREAAAPFIASLPANAEPGGLKDFKPMRLEKKKEGFMTSGKVQYVSRCGNFRSAGYEFSGAMNVLKVIMSYEYLWNQIRVIGGAYGCGGSFQRNGDCAFTSYRDPHLRRTNEVYEGIPEYVENFTVDERDMTKYVIGTIGAADTPLTPSLKGLRSLHAWVGGITWEENAAIRAQILDCTQEDIRALAPMIRAVLDADCLCAVGSEDKLKEEKDLFDVVETF